MPDVRVTRELVGRAHTRSWPGHVLSATDAQDIAALVALAEAVLDAEEGHHLGRALNAIEFACMLETRAGAVCDNDREVIAGIKRIRAALLGKEERPGE